LRRQATGDVLSGMIGAFIAQGFGILTGTLAAVWLHGRAAEVYGADVGLVASEVPELAVRELARLRMASRAARVSRLAALSHDPARPQFHAS